jgi:PhnB protein
MQTFVPYLAVPNAKKAIDVYSEIFGATLEEVSYGNSIPGMETNEEAAKIIINAKLTLKNGDYIFLQDSAEIGNHKTSFGNNIGIVINFATEDEITACYNKLISNKDRIIMMELGDPFWGGKYALIQDEFNVVWHLTLPVSN